MAVHALVQFDTILDMKNYDVSGWTVGSSLMASALLIDATTGGDERGGLYRWVPDSTAAELFDGYFNAITSNTTATGRWVRVFQRILVYPQGTLNKVGNSKSMFVNGVTDSNGEMTVNLTVDNSAGGTAIFSDVYKVAGFTRQSASNILNAAQSYVKVFPSSANGFKQVTVGFYKATQPTTILAGIVYQPRIIVDANTPVSVEIFGA